MVSMIKLQRRSRNQEYDLAKLPEDFVRLEYPEYYDTVRRNKFKDPLMYLS
ncbi:hypothetical protein GWK48_00295 [Metallosphaera tengchongensis]|uniref:Uncharacterized protein n=1 Tax=Metallosphaera tengchongensis TaxID=1532350 RepID=A0A6N0NQI8_9CREN|nr:hypothetical protein [Metallosphaera tengchongensis]QKQ98985.1 hypothetical protein GWK48_00295 [Metallosphaera tengchongensis]